MEYDVHTGGSWHGFHSIGYGPSEHLPCHGTASRQCSNEGLPRGKKWEAVACHFVVWPWLTDSLLASPSNSLSPSPSESASPSASSSPSQSASGSPEASLSPSASPSRTVLEMYCMHCYSPPPCLLPAAQPIPCHCAGRVAIEQRVSTWSN